MVELFSSVFVHYIRKTKTTLLKVNQKQIVYNTSLASKLHFLDLEVEWDLLPS
jgi:hypothetical protein